MKFTLIIAAAVMGLVGLGLIAASQDASTPEPVIFPSPVLFPSGEPCFSAEHDETEGNLVPCPEWPE